MRGKSLVEVLLVYFILVAIASLKIASGFVAYEIGLLYYSYSTALSHFGGPLVVIFLAKRSLREYTITTDAAPYATEVGINSTLARVIPYMSAMFLMMYFSLALLDWITVLVMSGGYVIATVLLWTYLNKREESGTLTRENAPSLPKNIAIIFVMLLVPIFLGLYLNQLSDQLLSLVIWQFFVSGFGEEFFYRGYVQTTLNKEFGKPFKIFEIEFGWGLIIASLMFALSHAISFPQLLLGTLTLNISWGVLTFFSGLFFGLVREKTKSLIAPGLAHGLADAIGEGIGFVLGLT